MSANINKVQNSKMKLQKHKRIIIILDDETYVISKEIHGLEGLGQ